MRKSGAGPAVVGAPGLARSHLVFSPKSPPVPFSLHFAPFFTQADLTVRNPHQIPQVQGLGSGARSRVCSPCNYLTGPRRQRQPPAGNKMHMWFLR